MPVLVMCSNPGCSELFDAPDEAIGRKVRCPSCGTVQEVRAAASPKIGDQPAGRVRFAQPVEDGQTPGISPKDAADRSEGVPPAGSPSAGSRVSDSAAAVGRRPAAQEAQGEFLLEAESPPAASATPPTAPAAPAADSDEPLDLVPMEGPLPGAADRLGRPAPAVPGIAAGKGKPPVAGQAPASFRATPPKVVGGKPGAAPSQPSGEVDLVAAEAPPAEETPRAASAAAAPTASAAAAQGEIQFSSVLDNVSLTNDGMEGPATVAVSDGVLENKWSEGLIFLLGLAGMAIGLTLGLLYLDYHWVANAYLGGVMGWVGGFTLAFLIVLVADKTETPKLHCPVCHNVFPIDTELCLWCGAPLAEPSFNPLASDCLYAGSYATTNIGSLILMSLLATVTAVLVKLCVVLPDLFPSMRQAGPGLIVLAGLLTFLVLSYAVAFLLRSIGETMSRSRTAPDLPPFFALRNSTDTLKLLALCVVYVGPIFTIPLLPLGLLALGSPGKVSPFDLRGMGRVLGRHAKDFVILWLLLLLWGAGGVLATALLAVARIILGDWIGGWTADMPPTAQFNTAKLTVDFVGLAATTFVLAAIVCIFGLSLCRCIGIFGRHNANLLIPARDIPQESPPDEAPGA